MELCLNEQPCLSTSPISPSSDFFFSPPLNTHTLTSSSFHLQKAVCTLNTPMHSTPLGHIRSKEEIKYYCQTFRFRVFILHALVTGGKRTNTAEARHIYPLCETLHSIGKIVPPALPSDSTRNCFYNRSHLAFSFNFTPAPCVSVSASPTLYCDTVA